VIELILPDSCLVVLIGAAGAGKTTFAARHFEPAEILSSDAYRALIAGDESDQRATRAVFGRLHRALERRLADGLLTIVDATNVERSARRALLVRAMDAGLPSIAIVLDLPPATIVARNAARSSRIVDERVVRRHLERLRHSLDGPGARLRDEGFRQIIILREPLELDELRIVRRPARPARPARRGSRPSGQPPGPGRGH
jgi:protein phosphatase